MAEWETDTDTHLLLWLRRLSLSVRERQTFKGARRGPKSRDQLTAETLDGSGSFTFNCVIKNEERARVVFCGDVPEPWVWRTSQNYWARAELWDFCLQSHWNLTVSGLWARFGSDVQTFQLKHNTTSDVTMTNDEESFYWFVCSNCLCFCVHW